MHIISFMGKGGVGKTTLSLAVAREMSERRRVLLVDGDTQDGGLSDVLGISANEGLAEVLRNEAEVGDVAIRDRVARELSVLPCGLDLDEYRFDDYDRDEFVMDEIFSELDFDVVIVDCAPTLGSIVSRCMLVSSHQICVVTGPTPQETRKFREIKARQERMLDELGGIQSKFSIIVNNINPKDVSEPTIAAINDAPDSDIAYPSNTLLEARERLENLRHRAEFVTAVPRIKAQGAEKRLAPYFDLTAQRLFAST